MKVQYPNGQPLPAEMRPLPEGGDTPALRNVDGKHVGTKEALFCRLKPAEAAPDEDRALMLAGHVLPRVRIPAPPHLFST